MTDQAMHLLLGEIKGKLDLVINNQEKQAEQLDGFNTRIGKVETRAAGHGMITGAIAAVGVALIKGKLGV